ncbi:MAG: hypothetical protein H6718_06960 [Polyangiaceae bacterium]|nr:hypothetical protein [Myxococcales bacterium]MCB9585119.1 hypothetical protein [Polyangiaceae bacterium]
MSLGSARPPSCVLLCLLLAACSRESTNPRAEAPPQAPSNTASLASHSSGESGDFAPPSTRLSKGGTSGKAPRRAAKPKPNLTPYPWMSEHSELTVRDDLAVRVPAPAGFARVELAEGSFGAWLRHLPMLPYGTPVRSYAGGRLRDGESDIVTGVVALDVGDADLQQCADAVMRLHGEWRWSQGGRDQSYRAASGTPLDYRRWAQGQRIVAKGASISWAATGKAKDDHQSFRKFMDAVFAWSNTVALSRMGKHVEYAELRPGDFFVQPGNPGHTVLVLDLVRGSDGSQRVLLGQSYMPAQNFHVLKSPDGPWFRLSADADVKTPLWPRPFKWEQLRRLDG